MFCSRNVNDRIGRLHERSLRIACDDYTSSFEQLLEMDQRNLSAPATEMYKDSYDLLIC